MTDPADAMPLVLRAPMRARSNDAPAGAGADFGVAMGLVGIGERVDDTGASLAEVIAALVRTYGEKAGRMLAGFAALPVGTFVWTRQSDGTFRLGRISGGWVYDDSAGARAVGIHQVRPTEWSTVRFDAKRVPAAVARTFARGGRNLQRIHDPAVGTETLRAWKNGPC